jgi:hypothetical protein
MCILVHIKRPCLIAEREPKSRACATAVDRLHLGGPAQVVMSDLATLGGTGDGN